MLFVQVVFAIDGNVGDNSDVIELAMILTSMCRAIVESQVRKAEVI